MKKPLKEQMPYLWLQEYEGEGKASCGCLLGYDADGSAQFTFCSTHEAAPKMVNSLSEIQEIMESLFVGSIPKHFRHSELKRVLLIASETIKEATPSG